MLCKDGEYLYYNAGLMKQWHSFCKAIGRGDLVEDERCKSTSALFVNKKSLYKDVSEAILQRSADEWVEILRAADVPCEKHRHLSDMATDEQLIENGFIRKSVYGETSVMVPTPPLAPSLVVDIGSDKGESVGAHTQDILESLGCPTDLINKLVASGDIIVSK